MIWWYTCSSREFLLQMLLRVIVVVSVAFVILLFAWDARNNIDVQLEVDTQQASMKTCSLMWKVFKENRITVLFITLSLLCFLVILSWSPRLAENEALMGVLYSVINRFVVGIVLPVTFSDLIKSSKQDENGLKTAFI